MNVFDHVKAIEQIQDKDYFEQLSEEDRRSYSIYMVNRVLSMKPHFLPLVDAFQIYSSVITPRLHYLFFSQSLPKSKNYVKYIKKSYKLPYDQNDIEIVSKHFNISSTDASYYLRILSKKDNYIKELEKLYSFYGRTRNGKNKN